MVDGNLAALFGSGVVVTRGGSNRDTDVGEEVELGGGGTVNLDSICDSVLGLSAEDAELEVRATLRQASGNVSEADVIGVLLRVFRNARDAALEGNEEWDVVTSHCDMLTRLCDRNFIGCVDQGRNELPASIVASIYAECGRTLSLADQLPKARDRLEKALNVFKIVPATSLDDLTSRQVAAAHASLARVMRRSAPNEGATFNAYMFALQKYAELDGGVDTLEFVSELCEVLCEMDGEAMSPSLPELLVELAEEKFGRASVPHLRVMREVADACADAGRLDLAATALASRAAILRESSGRSRARLAEAIAAEEEAAKALEASLPRLLESGDLVGATASWRQAVSLRSSVEGADSSLVLEMKKTLGMLEEASAGVDGRDTAEDDDEEFVSSPGKESQTPPDAWDDESVGGAPGASGYPTQRALAPQVSLLSHATVMSLRPAWASSPPGDKPPLNARDDSWDS